MLKAYRDLLTRVGLLALLLWLSGGAAAWATTGIEGRTAWRGDLIVGVRVSAYRKVEDIAAHQPVAVSAATGQDGTYQLELPPGNYILTARNFDRDPQPGDYFCYFSGSPAMVRAGVMTPISFNLTRVPNEAAIVNGTQTGIRGSISYQDQPLERVYLYVYQNAADGFKGPGYNIVPVEKGSFKLRLPPGDYYLLARKRLKGGRFGPIEPGDYFNYYYANPVHIASGTLREVKLDMVTRLTPEQAKVELPGGVLGQVLGPDGKPAAGMYVFGYRNQEMTGTPDIFSDRTDTGGHFHLALPETGTWYLLARQSFGGPAADGELYGRYGGDAARPLQVDSLDSEQQVSIHVAPKVLP